MKEFMINPAKTCAVTGHRIIFDLDRDKLKQTFINIIQDGYDTFLDGFAIGFDTVCFDILTEIKKEKDIKIIGCLPCINQSEKFNLSQKEKYNKMLASADEIIYVTEKFYTPDCMMKRNKFMVDRCSLVLAYLRKNSGGTYKTVLYADEKGIAVEKI